MRFCVIACFPADCVLHVSGERPARVRIAFDYACLDKVGSLAGKNDWHVRKGSIKPVHSVERASDDEDTCIELTQFDSKLRIPTKIPFGGPDGKGIVHPIDEALILQSLPERCNSLANRRHIRFLHHQKPDQRHVRCVWVYPGRGILSAVAPISPMKSRRCTPASKDHGAAV